MLQITIEVNQRPPRTEAALTFTVFVFQSPWKNRRTLEQPKTRRTQRKLQHRLDTHSTYLPLYPRGVHFVKKLFPPFPPQDLRPFFPRIFLNHNFRPFPPFFLFSRFLLLFPPFSLFSFPFISSSPFHFHFSPIWKISYFSPDGGGGKWQNIYTCSTYLLSCIDSVLKVAVTQIR